MRPNGVIILTRDQIARRVAELGAQITADYADREIVLIGVLRGVIPFFADLMRAIERPLTVDLMAISSYGSGTGVVRIIKDLDQNIEGRHVILVEDVVDTGLTLRYIVRNLQERRPASLAVCTLLDKNAHRLVSLPIRYIGFTIEDVFVVGYGLDDHQQHRNLPDLWQLNGA